MNTKSVATFRPAYADAVKIMRGPIISQRVELQVPGWQITTPTGEVLPPMQKHEARAYARKHGWKVRVPLLLYVYEFADGDSPSGRVRQFFTSARDAEAARDRLEVDPPNGYAFRKIAKVEVPTAPAALARFLTAEWSY